MSARQMPQAAPKVVLLILLAFCLTPYDGGFTASMLFVVGLAVVMARRFASEDRVKTESAPASPPTSRRAIDRLSTYGASQRSSSEALFHQSNGRTVSAVSQSASHGFAPGPVRLDGQSAGVSRIVAAPAPPAGSTPGSRRRATYGPRWLFAPIKTLLSKLHPKAYPYFRAVLGFIVAMGVMLALKNGKPASDKPFSTLLLIFPTLVLSVMIAPLLAVAIRVVAGQVMALGIPRGFADILVGVILTAVYWVPGLLDPSAGSSSRILNGLGFAFCGAMAGFEFWRADGYPGASRSLAQWLGGMKDGFLKGLGR